MRNATDWRDLTAALVLCFGLAITGCRAQEPVLQIMNNSSADPQQSLMQTPEWKGVRAITIICRVNGALGGGFGQTDNQDLIAVERDARRLICELAKRVITDRTNAGINVRIKQRPDGELLEADHAGIMIDTTLEWRDTPFIGVAMAISSGIFRHNPEGPPGAFFRSPPKILIFATSGIDYFRMVNHADAIEAVLTKQMVNLLR
ncbi:MAG: hypothetical protein IID54_06145 [Proteobacteria bacterium]|nr:hypothetical protein [Pseudomonadota bacterium]